MLARLALTVEYDNTGLLAELVEALEAVEIRSRRLGHMRRAGDGLGGDAREGCETESTGGVAGDASGSGDHADGVGREEEAADSTENVPNDGDSIDADAGAAPERAPEDGNDPDAIDTAATPIDDDSGATGEIGATGDPGADGMSSNHEAPAVATSGPPLLRLNGLAERTETTTLLSEVLVALADAASMEFLPERLTSATARLRATLAGRGADCPGGASGDGAGVDGHPGARQPDAELTFGKTVRRSHEPRVASAAKEVVVSGTARGLVEYMGSEHRPESGYVSTFLLTYHEFVDPAVYATSVLPVCVAVCAVCAVCCVCSVWGVCCVLCAVCVCVWLGFLVSGVWGVRTRGWNLMVTCLACSLSFNRTTTRCQNCLGLGSCTICCCGSACCPRQRPQRRRRRRFPPPPSALSASVSCTWSSTGSRTLPVRRFRALLCCRVCCVF